MRQRVMIAMATITGPGAADRRRADHRAGRDGAGADLEILCALRTDKKTAMALVTHDMGVIAGLADRVQVMRQGEIVESGTADEIFYAPAATTIPACCWRRCRAWTDETPPPAASVRARRCWRVEDLKVSFPVSRGLFRKPLTLRAVDGSASPCTRARPWAWSAKPAAASPPWRAPCCSFCRKTAGTRRLAGPRPDAADRERHARAPRGPADRLPGPAGEPRSAHADRRVHRRAAARSGAAACRAPR